MTNNPQDKVRLKVLNFFYQKNLNAIGETQKFSTEAHCSSSLQNETSSLQRKDVSSAIQYLTDKNFLKREVESSSTKYKGQTIKNKSIYYRIKAYGIDQIEGESDFFKDKGLSNVKIVGTNVVAAIGNNHKIQNVTISQEINNLDELKQFLIQSQEVKEDDKKSIESAIAVIKEEIKKDKPEKGIIKEAWLTLSRFATLAGASEFFQKAQDFIEPMLSPSPS